MARKEVSLRELRKLCKKQDRPIYKKKIGKYKPTEEDRDIVIRMASLGLTSRDVGAVLGLSHSAVMIHHRLEMEIGNALLLNKAAGVIYQALREGDTDAAKFVLARKGKWSETQKHEIDHSIKVVTDQEMDEKSFLEHFGRGDIIDVESEEATALNGANGQGH